MTNGTKVGLWALGLGVAGLDGYFTFNFLTDLKAKGDAEKAAADAAANAPKTGSSNTSVPKAPVVTTPVTTPGFSTVTTLKIGSKIFAGAKAANAYKSATANSTNIYKYYPAGSYIGTYLAKDGIYSKIIVEETGIFTNSSKTVWVPTADIKY